MCKHVGPGSALRQVARCQKQHRLDEPSSGRFHLSRSDLPGSICTDCNPRSLILSEMALAAGEGFPFTGKENLLVGPIEKKRAA